MPIYSFPEPRYIWGAGCSVVPEKLRTLVGGQSLA